MKRIFYLLFFVSILLLESCGTVEMESQWRDREITIDGKTGDWQGQLVPIKDSGLSFGLLNDEKNIYICVSAAERRVASQVFRQGLVVWFDPQGGKDKILGIRYPLGMEWSDFQGPPGGEAGGQENARRGVRRNLDEIEILGPGRDEKTRLHLDELKGIQAAVATSGGAFIYELKVPLIKSEETPSAAGSAPGKIVGIGFDRPEPDVFVGRGMGGRIPGGFGPGLRGGFGGRGMMIGTGRGFRNEEPIKIWLKAHLAQENKKAS